MKIKPIAESSNYIVYSWEPLMDHYGCAGPKRIFTRRTMTNQEGLELIDVMENEFQYKLVSFDSYRVTFEKPK